MLVLLTCWCLLSLYCVLLLLTCCYFYSAGVGAIAMLVLCECDASDFIMVLSWCYHGVSGSGGLVLMMLWC